MAAFRKKGNNNHGQEPQGELRQPFRRGRGASTAASSGRTDALKDLTGRIIDALRVWQGHLLFGRALGSPPVCSVGNLCEQNVGRPAQDHVSGSFEHKDGVGHGGEHAGDSIEHPVREARPRYQLAGGLDDSQGSPHFPDTQ